MAVLNIRQGRRVGLLTATFCLFSCIFSHFVFAVTLEQAGAVRQGFQFPLGNVSESSYDGPQFDAFKPFSGVLGSEIMQLSAFAGHQGEGSLLEVFMLSESAYFDGRDPKFANNFGVIDSAGNFISLLDSATADPGASAAIIQGEDQQFTFALQSPEALFSSVDSANPDASPHMLAKKVIKDAVVEISPVSLRSDGPLTFQLLAGDTILFLEDMLAHSNLGFLGVPELGDFDFNDMVVLVRQTQIPEPGTLALLGSALLFISGKKRLKQRG